MRFEKDFAPQAEAAIGASQAGANAPRNLQSALIILSQAALALERGMANQPLRRPMQATPGLALPLGHFAEAADLCDIALRRAMHETALPAPATVRSGGQISAPALPMSRIEDADPGHRVNADKSESTLFSAVSDAVMVFAPQRRGLELELANDLLVAPLPANVPASALAQLLETMMREACELCAAPDRLMLVLEQDPHRIIVSASGPRAAAEPERSTRTRPSQLYRLAIDIAALTGCRLRLLKALPNHASIALALPHGIADATNTEGTRAQAGHVS